MPNNFFLIYSRAKYSRRTIRVSSVGTISGITNESILHLAPRALKARKQIYISIRAQKSHAQSNFPSSAEQ